MRGEFAKSNRAVAGAVVGVMATLGLVFLLLGQFSPGKADSTPSGGVVETVTSSDESPVVPTDGNPTDDPVVVKGGAPKSVSCPTPTASGVVVCLD